MRIIEVDEEQNRLEFAQKAGSWLSDNPHVTFYGNTNGGNDIYPDDMVAIRAGEGMVVVLRADQDFEPVKYPEMISEISEMQRTAIQVATFVETLKSHTQLNLAQISIAAGEFERQVTLGAQAWAFKE